MPTRTIAFTNAAGHQLSGKLEVPEGGIRCCAVFAHCFTCGKDIAAATRITRELARLGVAVLRFDHAGLGKSEGEFADTNFSSNVDDLVCAANALAAMGDSPQLLIGHSLGGAAVLAAAARLPDVRAIVTIGAPSTAHHVGHVLGDKRDLIERDGEAQLKLGARTLTIRKQFIDDLDRYTSTDALAKLNKAVLVMHSPQDKIVSIDEAARIYKSVRHPKSFVSLDGADHLLSKSADSAYAARVMCTWLSRYVDTSLPEMQPAPEQTALKSGEVLVTEKDHKFLLRMFTTDHEVEADEPASYGGSNLGPTPYDLLLMSLGACTTMTIRMYAERKKIPLDDVSVTLEHRREHVKDCGGCEDEGKRIDHLVRRVNLVGDLSDEQRAKLLGIADKCPVHRTLEGDIRIATTLAEA